MLKMKTALPEKIRIEQNIISVMITTNKSKIILARQFTRITKRDLTHLSSMFVRNLDSNKNKENNLEKNFFDVVEEELDCRFIFQTLKIKNLFLVLVTKSTFNIFTGLELLKMVHRIVNEICNLKDVGGWNMNEMLNDVEVDNEKNIQNNSNFENSIFEDIIKSIKEKAVDLILAIDDIINPIQGKEESNLSNVKLNLKMDSNNEKVFSIIQKQKEDKARDNIIKGIEEIERMKRENKYVNNAVSSEQIGGRIDIQNNIIETTPSIGNNNNMNRHISSGMSLKERFIRSYFERTEEQISNKIKFFLIFFLFL